MRIAQGLSIVSIALLVAGCESSAPYTYTTPSGQVVSTVPGRSASDVALETSLRAELERYGDLAAVSPDVRIDARDGAVTLSGAVRTERDREMINALVRNTPGVLAVNDQLQVNYPPTGTFGEPPRVYSSPPPTVPGPSAEVVTPEATIIPGSGGVQVQATTSLDQPLARRICDRFRWDSVPTAWLQNATITANSGDVYLQGYVDDSREHQAILSSVQHTAGVRNIYDQLRVK